jgi:predicted metal-dependent peptidase
MISLIPSVDTIEDKLSYARAAVVFDAPYFASVVHGFIYVPVEGLGTMGVTAQMVLAYDPQWINEASIKELAADIVHEVNHFMRRHFERGATVEDKNLFNLAGDLTINPDMRNTGIWELAGEKSTRPAIFPAHVGLPEGLSTEEYYDRLLQMKHNGATMPTPSIGNSGKGAPNKQGGGQNPQQKQDQSQSGHGATPSQQTQEPAGQPDQDGGQSKQEPKPGLGNGVCSGHCGSIAGGTDDPRLVDKLNAEHGRSAVEMETITKKTAADIAAHIEANGRGSVPAGLAELAKALIEEPHVRWQTELAHVIRHSTGRVQAGGEDFSMSRPSKRSIMRGIVRPGMIEHQPEVAIVRDTSGSMNIEQLNACIREAYHILLALGVDEAWFTDADADVAMPWKRVGPQFFRTLNEAHGRGGTSFIPAIKAADKLFPRPDILIYCTDGDGAAPKKPPMYMDIVWCLILGGYARNKAPARYGHTVFVTEDPKQRKAAVILPDEPDEDDEDDISI